MQEPAMLAPSFADSEAKLATNKMLIELKIHLIDCNTIIAKHLYSHQDHSSQSGKLKQGQCYK